MQVELAHMTLQTLCKLLMTAIVIAAIVPGFIHSRSISPAVIATLLAGQVLQRPIQIRSFPLTFPLTTGSKSVYK